MRMTCESRVGDFSSSTDGILNSPSDLPLLEIPPKPNVFYGRDDLVASIVELLLQDKPCRLPILGTGGMGKTSVAAAAINDARVREKYGPTIIFVSCEGVVSAEGIISALATALGIRHESTIRRAVFAYLASRGYMLLVLDNLETAAQSADSEHVERLLGHLAALSHLSLVITMRGSMPPAGVDWEELDILNRLSLDAARQIWHRVARTDDAQLDQLLVMLDGLPLAITLMAHQGRLFTPSQLLSAYEKETTRLIKVGAGGRLKSLEVSIRLSLQSEVMLQEPNALQLLSLLCLLPDGVPLGALQEMLPSLSHTLTAAISVLRQVALTFEENERLRVLSPIRDFILAHHPPKDPTLGELRRHYSNLTLNTCADGAELTKDTAGKLLAEFINVTAVLTHSWVTLPTIGARLGMARCAQDLGNLFYAQSRYENATLRFLEAKEAFEAIGNRLGAAQSLVRLGDILYMQDRYEDAFHTVKEAKASFDSIGSRSDVAHCMRSLGNILRMQNRYGEATQMLQNAKVASEAIGDRLGAARCMQSLASILQMQGSYGEAIDTLREALAAFHTMGDGLNSAHCMMILGEVLNFQNRKKEAVQMLDEAQTISVAVGHSSGIAECKRVLGDVLYRQGNYQAAADSLSEAKEVFKSVSDRDSWGKCLRSLGEVLYGEHRYEEATDNMEEARSMFAAIGSRVNVAHCDRSLAMVLVAQDRPMEAESMLIRARNQYEGLNLPKKAEECTEALAGLRSKMWDGVASTVD
ncbi:TPR-like protein [Calocera viscosa TUFC12733]|uniref:TPR-like protein n=1 Tax=Calocera viscosa (strain TUFC12733) TaxID=1330018 RepID=A0A167HPG5_CALVF|nr:TPR-like protein [Calocera viscosa TUFC12733]